MNQPQPASAPSLNRRRLGTLRGLSDQTLLVGLLDTRQGARQRAGRLLRGSGGWRGLRRRLHIGTSIGDLEPGESLRVATAMEVGRRLLLEPPANTPLSEPAAVASRYQALGLEEVEHLIAVGLDSGRRTMIEHRLGGVVDGVYAQPRDLLRPLIAAGAVAMLVVHNHPSGCREPSASDLAFTRRLAAAGGLCGVPLLDHLIIAGAGWTSLAQRGHVPVEHG